MIYWSVADLLSHAVVVLVVEKMLQSANVLILLTGKLHVRNFNYYKCRRRKKIFKNVENFEKIKIAKKLSKENQNLVCESHIEFIRKKNN